MFDGDVTARRFRLHLAADVAEVDVAPGRFHVGKTGGAVETNVAAGGSTADRPVHILEPQVTAGRARVGFPCQTGDAQVAAGGLDAGIELMRHVRFDPQVPPVAPEAPPHTAVPHSDGHLDLVTGVTEVHVEVLEDVGVATSPASDGDADLLGSAADVHVRRLCIDHEATSRGHGELAFDAGVCERGGCDGGSRERCAGARLRMHGDGLL